MAIELKKEGARIYIVGNTFAVKDRLKSELGLSGKNFDGEKKCWWCGATKLAAAEKLVAELNGAAAGTGSANKPATTKQNPDDIRLTGKGRYKGKVYFAGAVTKDGARVRLLTLPNDKGEFLDFWADTAQVEEVKRYEPREYRGRTTYTTLGSIARFVEKAKRAEASGDVLPESLGRRTGCSCGSREGGSQPTDCFTCRHDAD